MISSKQDVQTFGEIFALFNNGQYIFSTIFNGLGWNCHAEYIRNQRAPWLKVFHKN